MHISLDKTPNQLNLIIHNPIHPRPSNQELVAQYFGEWYAPNGISKYDGEKLTIGVRCDKQCCYCKQQENWLYKVNDNLCGCNNCRNYYLLKNPHERHSWNPPKEKRGY